MIIVPPEHAFGGIRDGRADSHPGLCRFFVIAGRRAAVHHRGGGDDHSGYILYVTSARASGGMSRTAAAAAAVRSHNATGLGLKCIVFFFSFLFVKIMSVDWRPMCPFSSVFIFNVSTLYIIRKITCVRACTRAMCANVCACTLAFVNVRARACVSVVAAAVVAAAASAAATFRAPGKLVFVAHDVLRGPPGAIDREHTRSPGPSSRRRHTLLSLLYRTEEKVYKNRIV